jgi:hypothetical protein
MPISAAILLRMSVCRMTLVSYLADTIWRYANINNTVREEEPQNIRLNVIYQFLFFQCSIYETHQNLISVSMAYIILSKKKHTQNSPYYCIRPC